MKQASKEKGKKREPPSPCPLPPCNGKNKMHWIDDCETSTAAEKKVYKEQIIAAEARDVPSRSKRSQASSASDAASSSERNVGRLRQPNPNMADTDEAPWCIMTVSDFKESIEGTGCCDDGSDENIASPPMAERAAIMGFGKIEAIDPIIIEVALT